jgi:hypothetical protein
MTLITRVMKDEATMAICDLCNQPATRTTDKWFQFPRNPQRFTGLCEGHWDELLTALERRSNWVPPARPPLQDHPVSPPPRRLASVAAQSSGHDMASIQEEHSIAAA